MSRIPALGSTIVGLALALSLALVPSAAQAATGSVKDAKGDAPKSIDITSLKVNNSQKTVSGSVKVNKLGNAGIFTIVWLPGDLNGSSFGVNVIKKNKKSKAQTQLVKITENGAKKVKCKGLKGSWNTKKSVVTFRVPQKCHGKVPSSWTFSAASTSVKGSAGDSTEKLLTLERG